MDIQDKKDIEERKKPENPGENTADIFDSVFKTLLQRFPKLAVALINEFWIG